MAIWHIAPSYWNHKLAISISSNFGRKNCIIMSQYRVSLTVAAWPTSFLKKYDPIMPPVQNPHQIVTLWMHLFFANYTWVLRTRQFWWLTKPSRWKCVWIFCIKFSNFGRQTFIIFKILFNNENMLLHRITLHFH